MRVSAKLSSAVSKAACAGLLDGSLGRSDLRLRARLVGLGLVELCLRLCQCGIRLVQTLLRTSISGHQPRHALLLALLVFIIRLGALRGGEVAGVFCLLLLQSRFRNRTGGFRRGQMRLCTVQLRNIFAVIQLRNQLTLLDYDTFFDRRAVLQFQLQKPSGDLRLKLDGLHRLDIAIESQHRLQIRRGHSGSTHSHRIIPLALDVLRLLTLAVRIPFCAIASTADNRGNQKKRDAQREFSGL